MVRFVALVLLALAGPAFAQEDTLTGTLKKVHDSNSIVLGYRESSFPFSYITPGGTPLGYSIDLCREIADDTAAELGLPALNVVLKPVTAENRIAKLIAGDIDLECGSTTNNAERQKQVAFSPVIFIAGTKLLVPRSSPIGSFRDLEGRTVVVTQGTTNQAALASLAERRHMNVTFITAPEHAASFALLEAGKADAFATDDVLLYGLIATAKNGADYRVTGEFLSYEPYGLMFRRDDPAFATIVQGTFTRLATSGALRDYYRRWFTKRLPTGENLNIPMSAELTEVFRLLGQDE
jgi:glutamate/aspartate transport system substrate-binding protein